MVITSFDSSSRPARFGREVLSGPLFSLTVEETEESL